MKKVNHPSLRVQEMIYNHKRINAKYSNRKIETLYYTIRLWLVKKKIDQDYKKRRKTACKRK